MESVIYLWVDELIIPGYGETSDLKKIHYNLEQMGNYGKAFEQAINIQLLFVERDADGIGKAGRFICVTKFNKDENEASMSIYDCTILPENKWIETAEIAYPGYSAEFMKIYKEAVLSSLFPELDTFELSIRSPF